MADAGGYRKPTAPAAVSGPGRFSKRTDGGASQPIRDVTGGGYGDNAELRTLQGSAPMNASGRTSQMPAAMPTQGGPPVTGFGEPTTRPGEPVTAGNPMGPGAGAPDLSPGTQDIPDREYLQRWMPALEAMSRRDDTSETFRRFVRHVKGLTA